MARAMLSTTREIVQRPPHQRTYAVELGLRARGFRMKQNNITSDKHELPLGDVVFEIDCGREPIRGTIDLTMSRGAPD